MISGLILFIVVSILIAVYSNRSKNRYFRKILNNPVAFKESMRTIFQGSEESKLLEEEKIKEEDFEDMLTTYIKYLQQGNKIMIDAFMLDYFRQKNNALK